ncbi:MAG: hypothetical protein GY838_14810, partial [bacterium]|nr:hypothetical protein [bacterium]
LCQLAVPVFAGGAAPQMGEPSLYRIATGSAGPGLPQAGQSVFRIEDDSVKAGSQILTVPDRLDQGADERPESTGTAPRPYATLKDVPWTTAHIGIDQAGTGILHTYGYSGAGAYPFASPQIQFIGQYLPNDEAPGQDERVRPEQRPTWFFTPLGIPMETSLGQEEDEGERATNERQATAAFKLRVALPGSLGEKVTAKVQSLRILPDKKHLGQKEVGKAVAPSGGELWPSTEVVVTLYRLGVGENEVDPPADPTAVDDERGRFGVGFNLYESKETVLLLSDPRAQRDERTGHDYELQDFSDSEGEGYGRVADEKGQCRRCDWPSYLPDPDSNDSGDEEERKNIKELLAAGPYLRAFLFAPDCSEAGSEDVALCGGVTEEATSFTEDAIEYFKARGDNYRAPAGAAEVVAWADAVPSPIQVSLAEPARNPSMWSPGEAGVSTTLVSGEVMLGVTDHTVPGRSLAFVMERTYRSGVAGFGPLGSAGWSSRLFAHLREIRTTGEVEYHDGRGHIWRFYPKNGDSGGDDDIEGFRWAVPDGYDEVDDDDDDDSSASYYAPAGVYLELEKRGGGWRLIGRHNDIAIFNTQGRLIELRDRHRQAKDADEQGSTLFLEY